ncbi:MULTISPECIES: ABC transporter permease [unclassified Mesorhizobium]|uniref:ABC transporter permease n=1 Tax=unclassified Mesorhizobium TaxID=325217 RepID=UPI001673DAC4|nr:MULTISPECIES: ABC transporter permease [unclassified Mesorhizobium]
MFQQDPLVYLLIFLTALITFILYRTHAGLALRATGEYPRAADTAGINVSVMRFLALAISGGLAAPGGCQLVLSQVYVTSEGMSAGNGFIALAAIILGRWHPFGAVAAAFLFGFCDALQLRLQFSNPEIPYQIFLILPYAVSLMTMVWFLGKSRQPAAAGRTYDRESR